MDEKAGKGGRGNEEGGGRGSRELCRAIGEKFGGDWFISFNSIAYGALQPLNQIWADEQGGLPGTSAAPRSQWLVLGHIGCTAQLTQF